MSTKQLIDADSMPSQGLTAVANQPIVQPIPGGLAGSIDQLLALSSSSSQLLNHFLSSCRGIPGKKCGTIILSAEELGNCRVSNSLLFELLVRPLLLREQGKLLSAGDLSSKSQRALGIIIYNKVFSSLSPYHTSWLVKISCIIMQSMVREAETQTK